jgi:predicted phage replisome organizer
MKGIEWIKITTNMCEDETIRLIDSMEYRDAAIYLWLRLLLQAGKVNDNGLIYLKKDVPYTKQMLSILFNRPIDIIEKVLEILESFKMIKIYENNIIKICNWEKHQNIEGMKRVREGTRERVKNFREKKKENEHSRKKLPEKEFDENEPLENKFLEKENINNNTLINVANDSIDTNEINKNKNCNAHVTLQKEKREEDIKKKNIDIKEREEELDAQALKLMKDLEKINININGLTLRWAQDMLAKHKEKHVKMDMGKAIERNKLDTNYINGILKNWLREGYPKTYEEIEFGNCEAGNLSDIKEKPKLRFINFEAREYDYKDLEKKLLGW